MDANPTSSRRRFERRPFTPNYLAFLIERPHFGGRPAYVMDASIAGLGLTSCEHVEVGSVVALQVQDGGLVSDRTLLATVRHSTCSNGRWVIGCELKAPLTDDELHCLGD